MYKNKKICITIPAYNEEKSIKKVIKSLPDFIDKIIIVDDCSQDKTSETVEQLQKTDSRIILIRHQKNQGVGAAFHTGIDYALENKADILVNIDADGQFDSSDIPKLLHPILNNEADFVTGSRFIRKDNIPNMPKIRLWGNKQIAKIVSYLSKNKFYDVSCGFRAYNKKALLNLNLFGSFTYTQETFLDLSFKGLRIKEIPVQVKYFSNRRSRVYRGAIRYAIDILKIILRTLRDYKPLKFFGWIGLTVFFMGLLLDVFVFIFYLQTGGFTPYKIIGLIGLVLNTIGIIILILGLIADMLYRIRMIQEKLLYYEKRRHYRVITIKE